MTAAPDFRNFSEIYLNTFHGYIIIKMSYPPRIRRNSYYVIGEAYANSIDR